MQRRTVEAGLQDIGGMDITLAQKSDQSTYQNHNFGSNAAACRDGPGAKSCHYIGLGTSSVSTLIREAEILLQA